MTTAEPAVRKPTAKEIAEEAHELATQLRVELTEVRDQLREGGTVNLTPSTGSGPLATLEQLDDLDRRAAEGFERLQVSMDAIRAAGGATGGDPDAVTKLQEATAAHFKKVAEIVDRNNEGATRAIADIRTELSGLPSLRAELGEIVEKVRLFDEAGVAPLSAEDGSMFEQHLKDAHLRMDEIRRDLNKTAEHVAGLTGPLLRGATAERTLTDAGTLVVPPAIYAQVHELMNAVTELGKDGKADPKMGGYAFRSIDSAMDAVGRALRQVGVMFQPREIVEKRIERYETVSKDGYRQNWTHVWVTQRYAFVSLVDGSEMAAIEMDGEARDNGDKSTSKADSMRLKYALLQALMIPVNGLPESDGSDGTEGGQVYGRGSAGDAFDSATPARPQPETSAPANEAQGTAYGYGHQPAESPGGQAHEQAQATPQDERTPEEKATAAYLALVALAGLEKPAQRPQLNRILQGISDQQLGGLMIMTASGTTQKLGDYAAVVNSQVGV